MHLILLLKMPESVPLRLGQCVKHPSHPKIKLKLAQKSENEQNVAMLFFFLILNLGEGVGGWSEIRRIYILTISRLSRDPVTREFL